MRRAVLILSAALISTSASAEFVDGYVLRKMLRESPLEANAYIMGVHDATRGQEHCSPSTLRIETLIKLTEAALAQPRLYDPRDSGDVILVKAMSMVWPCKRTT